MMSVILNNDGSCFGSFLNLFLVYFLGNHAATAQWRFLLSIQEKLVMTNKKIGRLIFLLSGVVVGY